MKKLIAFSTAIIIHVAILFGGNALYKPPEIFLQQGQSSIEMNLVPSIASMVASKDSEKQEKVLEPQEIVKEPELPNDDLEPEKIVEEEVPSKIDKVEDENDIEQEKTNNVENTIITSESILKKTDKIDKQEPPNIKKTPTSKPIVKKLASVNQEISVKIDTPKQVSQKKIEKEIKPNTFKDKHLEDVIDPIESVLPLEKASESDSDATQSKEVVGDILTKGITAPTMKGVSKPRYPSSCRKKGHEGVCILEATIDAKGRCTNIVVFQSAGCEKLDKSAIKSLKKAKFSAARSMGINIKSTKKVAFRFKIEDID